MDEKTRLLYLEAMGITQWQLKTPVSLPQITTAPSTASTVGPVNGETQPDGFNAAATEPVQQSSLEMTGQTAPSQSAASIENVDWEPLQSQVASCARCALSESRTQTVFGSGNQNADWLLIGEAPGQQEDLQGAPFVGPAGQLLTEMLRAIGLGREAVYIANLLKCRPPGNRDPKPEEVENCRPYLERQIALIRPKIILAVGRISAQTLLGTDAPVSKLRGKIHTLNHLPLVVVSHPSYLLRSPLEKKKAWLDLQLALNTYQQLQE